MDSSATRTSGLSLCPLAEAICPFGTALTGSSTALSVVLGGLLDGLLGSMVRFGVGAAESTSSCNGEPGVAEERRVDGVVADPVCGREVSPSSRAMVSTCLPT